MSVGKPKIPEQKTPAASPPPASTATAALQTGGTDESDLQASIKSARKGRSALRIEEGRAGKSAEASTLNTTSDFTIGKIDAIAPAPTASAPKPAAAPVASYTNDKTTGGTSPVSKAQAAAANNGSKPGGGNANDAMSGGTKNKNGVSTRSTPSPKANTSYSANKAGSRTSSKRDSSR